MSYIGSTPNTQSSTFTVDYFNGDGSTVAFTLSRLVSTTAQVQVIVNNVIQNPGSAFTVLNNTLTFSEAPSFGSQNIYVYYASPVFSYASAGSTGPTAGATGGGSDTVFVNNSQTISTSYAIPAGVNSQSVGPVTIADGAAVTLTGTTRWEVF